MKAKKTIALSAAALIALSAIAGGCGKKAETNGEDGKNELSYWIPLPAQVATYYSSMSEVTMYKELEKITGVKINFVHPTFDQAQEKFSLMIASGNLTDIVETDWRTYYQGGITKALRDGIIIELDDIIDKSAPNYKKFMEKNPETRRGVLTSDGHYCVFPRVYRSDEESKKRMRTNFGGMIIRKDWLDKCGLELPETIDEWNTALHAFKDKLGIKHPLCIESGWFKPEGNGNNFNNAYGIGMGWYLNNGKVKFGPSEKGYKEFIAQLNQWYKDGILDPDFDTISTSTTQSQVIEGVTGAFYGFIAGSIGKIMNSAELENGFMLAGTQYPVMNKGDEPYFMNSISLVTAPYAAITKNCKNPEVAAKMMDYFYSEKGAVLKTYGIEGLTYERVDENSVKYTDEIMHNEKGLTPTEALALHTRAYSASPGITAKTTVTTSKYDTKEQQDAYELYNKYVANGLKTQLPVFEYDIKTAEEVAAIEFDINNYVYENVVRFIKGAESMDKFDDFQKHINELNLKRLKEIKQKAYEKYINNN